MAIYVRTAAADDDLTVLWPHMAQEPLNRAQVLVACEEDTGALLGGLVCWDAGHATVYVGEFVVTVTGARRRHVARRLVTDTVVWARRRDRTCLFFHTADRDFAVFALKAGAQTLGTHVGFALKVDPLPWKASAVERVEREATV